MAKSTRGRSYAAIQRWTEAEGRSALAALAASGLSVDEFARREGIDPQRLYYWRRRLPEVSMPAFVEVRAPRMDLVEVVLRSGRVVRFAASIDTTALRRIVAELEDAVEC
jgi:transposase-like protein